MPSQAVSITVPSESNGAPIDATLRLNVLRDTLTGLAELFGGCTQTDAQGAWVGVKGLVTEPVVVCTSYADETDIMTQWDDVLALARDVKTRLAQDAVLVNVAPMSAVHFV